MSGLPLCVDLDGTLVRTDTLHEQLLMALRHPWGLLGTVPSLVRGRAAFKEAVAGVAPLPAAALPYREDLVAWLAEERAAGRRLVLVTAAHRSVADAVAAHLGGFEAVLASEAGHNLKGEAKAARLVAMFGEGGFCYAGDSAADLPVWARAGAAVTADAPARVQRAMDGRVPVERRFESAPAPGAMVRLLRPHQWVKNGLVFVPALAANALDAQTLGRAAITFAGFSLVASALYIWNDLLDLHSDRVHPRKRRRPLAAAQVPVTLAVALAVLLLIGGFAAGGLAGAALPLAAYAVLSTSYSAVLKTFPLVDVFALAGLYSVRLWGGAAATAIQLSVWLFAFSSFLFLSLAMLKRVGELQREEVTSTGLTRRGYGPTDAGMLTHMGIAASFAAVVVLSLYLQTDEATTRYASPHLLWLLVPLVLFWECRLWLATGRGFMNDDPVAYSLRDWVSWLTVLAGVAILFAARL